MAQVKYVLVRRSGLFHDQPNRVIHVLDTHVEPSLVEPRADSVRVLGASYLGNR